MIFNKHTNLKNIKYGFTAAFRLIAIVVFLMCAENGFSAANSTLVEIIVTVIDATNNEPLIGANIYTDDFKFVTVTDYEGKATLGNLGNRDEVNFSYVGYFPIKMPVYEIRKNGGLISMYPNMDIVDSIVVIGRRDDPVAEIPFKVDRVTSEDISFVNAQTGADALSQSGNVYIQKSQMGGGSPIIRGFEANKVLLVMDGVRMNNAIYRNGHHQNAITVDNAIMEQIEVIHGPGSLVYGSDALGGVVHFRTRDPKIIFGDDTKKNYVLLTNSYARFATANREKSIHFDVDYGNRRWGSLTSFTYTDYDDLKAGNKRPAEFPDFGLRDYYAVRLDGQDIVRRRTSNDIHVPTGYSQIDFVQKLKYQASDSLYFVFNLQYSTSSDIPRYDMLTETTDEPDDLKFTEWYYGPQNRLFASVKARSLKSNPLYDKAFFIAAFQNIDEDRFTRKLARIRRTFNKEDLQIYSFTADFDKAFDSKENSLLTYGVEFNYNVLASRAGNIHLRDETVVYDVLTRYPSGGSKMDALAGFANYRWRNNSGLLTANAGLRFTSVGLMVKYLETDLINWSQPFYDGISVRNNALTWGTGITLNTEDKWQVRVLAATAFRAPNIDDFAKIRKKSGFITVPNPELEPEKSLNGEITLAKEIGSITGEGDNKSGVALKVSGTLFYTRLTDAIVRQNFSLFDTISTIVNEDETLITQANVNAENSKLYGMSLNALFNINDRWKLKTSLNYTKGTSEIETEFGMIEVPMAHIPPTYGETSLNFQTAKLRLGGVVRYNWAKEVTDYAVSKIFRGESGELEFNREGTPDNLEYTPIDANGEYTGVYGWVTFNLYSSFRFNEHVTLDLAFENIGDVHYRNFGSGVSAPGRNFIAALKTNF